MCYKYNIGDVPYSILQFITLQYYFKMASPTLQQIFMNKQTTFEDREQISLFLRALILEILKTILIEARTIDQK